MELNQALDSLKNIRHGGMALDVGDALTQANEAIAAHGGTAEISIKLKIKTGPGGALEVIDDVTCKLPKDRRAKSSLLFAAPSGALLTNDPKQGDFGFQPSEVRVAQAEAKPRTVSNA